LVEVLCPSNEVGIAWIQGMHSRIISVPEKFEMKADALIDSGRGRWQVLQVDCKDVDQ